MKLKTGLTVAALAGAGALLAGCADQIGLDKEFNAMDMTSAVHEDMAAQIADPDAAYKGPPPPSNGARAEASMKRYETGAITSPTAPSSLVQIQGGGGGAGAGGGPQ
jgi:hypothetical protein